MKIINEDPAETTAAVAPPPPTTPSSATQSAGNIASSASYTAGVTTTGAALGDTLEVTKGLPGENQGFPTTTEAKEAGFVKRSTDRGHGQEQGTAAPAFGVNVEGERRGFIARDGESGGQMDEVHEDDGSLSDWCGWHHDHSSLTGSLLVVTFAVGRYPVMHDM